MEQREVSASDELERLRRILLLRSKEILLGSLIGSFVHDLNNPLTTISGNVELLQFGGGSNTDPKTKKRLDSIQSAVGRLSEKLRCAQLFAKPGRADEEFDLNRIAREAVAVACWLPKSTKTVVSTKLPDEPLTVAGNPNRLACALLAIIDNALDATTNYENPIVAVETRRISEEKFSVSISNNGPEIEAQIRELIFEPFFTTKENSVGLGLFIARRLVEENNGEIEWRTSPERTEFSIILRKSH